MSKLSGWWTRLRRAINRRAFDQQMAEEMREHLERETAHRIRQGDEMPSAHRHAAIAFGHIDSIKERVREERFGAWGAQLLQDVRYAIRSLRKHRGFTVIVVLTLALGIGANTAIFSIVHGVLLKPLGYREPDRLVTLLHDGQWPVAPADFLDWRARSANFETLAAAEMGGGILTDGERPESVPGIKYGEGMFGLLGVHPLLGRGFQSRDFASNGDAVVVLGHSLWQRRYGGDPAVLGRTITISGQARTIIGVMPSGFQFFPFWATRAELATPLELSARATNRGSNSLRVLGRLPAGVSVTQAQVEMNGICRQLEQAYPDTNTGRTVRVEPLLTKTVGAVRGALRMLAVAVGLVLLIACANVANLLLARATARQKEMAVRAALGAGRGRMIRQLLTESGVLALSGGALGLAFAYGGIGVFRGTLAAHGLMARTVLPRLSEVAIDGPTLWFNLAVVVLTAVAFGLGPAWQAARFAQQDALQEGGRGTTGGRWGQHARHVLVVVQIGVALITLVGAGLMLRSFLRVASIDSGFEPRGVLSLVVSLHGQAEMVDDRRDAFYRDVLAATRALPGVTSASAVNHLPLAGDMWSFGVAIEDRPLPPPGEGIVAVYRVCFPGYFETIGATLVGGRDFSAGDLPESPGVVVVNEQLARRQWPHESPVGKRLTLDDPAGKPRWLTIVGVVNDIKQRDWIGPTHPEVYLPYAQTPFRSDAAPHHAAMTLVLRSSIEPSSLVESVRHTIGTINRSAPITDIATLEHLVAGAVWQPRFNFVLTGLFAGLALVLASMGVYGVIAYAVASRTREFGIRLALGASGRDMQALVWRYGLRLIAPGIVLGLAGALAATRVLANLLYDVAPTDPWSFLGGVVLLSGMAVIAAWLPARRVTRVEPNTALRHE